ncbi:MAG: FAD-binding and (Fe-S)-binding domain-containing protein [Euryarchaeota archaeon]|nr:FAD-binding and (Fe-S)-binding domain-containing protein [Euryarchaeota archaeon]
MNRIEKALRNVRGEVYTDTPTLYCYSTDASIYRIVPSAVVCPLDAHDVKIAVNAAGVLGIPVTARAAGTNLAGSSLGTGIILDLSKNMNKILGIVQEGAGDQEFFVDVEPGVVFNDIQAYLGERGLFLPPDPSSSEICMIGGNLGTKASGARSVKYGTIDDYVAGVEFVTADGEIIDTTLAKTIPDRISNGLLGIKERVLTDSDTIARLESKRGVKTASGYNIRALFDYEEIGDVITHLMSGSVGTLGIFTKIRLKVLSITSGRSISAIYFKNLYDAGDAVQHIRELGPVKIEMMDSTSLAIVGTEYPDMGVPEDASALFVEFEGDRLESKIRDLEELIGARYDIYGEVASESADLDAQERVWAVRKALVPILTNYDSDTKPDAFIDDVAVAVSDLAPLIGDLHEIFDEYGIVSAIYGHAGSGNLHIRPMLNLNDPKNIDLLPELVNRVYDVVFKYNGTMTGEHGMGRLRTMFLEKEWGERIYGYMRQIKELFDPECVLNPDVMFSDRKITDDIKYPTEYINQFEKPCVNCGYCKSVCPISITMGGETGSRSFLQLARFRKLENPTAAESRRAGELLEMCLGCLRCATRCPSHASVGEMLFSQKTPPVYIRKAMGMWASDFNRFGRYSRFFGRITRPAAGAVLRRDIPKMRKKLPVFEDYVQNPDAMNVAVFMGCASAILDDGVLDSMIRVLKKSGFNVTVLEHNCCGLPMIAEGLYDLAKDTARKVVTTFASESTSADRRYDAIVTACASCTMMLKRFGGLLAEEDCEVRDAAARVSSITYDIGEFLAKFVDEEVFSKEKLDIRAVYHNPCHLAAAGVKDSSLVLGLIVSEFAELSDGCCGGAGAYSFLHSGSSDMIFDRKIEEIRRIDPDVVITTCPSCELQFRHGLARNDLRCDVMNIVEVVDRYYQHLQGDIPED